MFGIIFFLYLIILSTSIQPFNWTCEVWKYDEDAYSTEAYCDCDCGVIDKDCDTHRPIRGCPGSAIECDDTTAKCLFPATPPAEWTCSDAHYNDGEGCDCECGAYDPDCYDTDYDIHGCASHVNYCLYEDGSCHYDYPLEWQCDRFSYNSSETCDCNCGAYDPDCDNSSLAITGCGLHVLGCTKTGHCLFPDTPPPEWKPECHDDWYGHDRWCDCNCGAYDPDCEDHTKKLYGCSAYPESDWCSYEGTCIVDPYHLWTCPVSEYDDGLVCNCNCGKYDPDCDRPDVPITGCPPSAVGCNLDGTCKYPVPDGWICSVAQYNSNDGCHCNCGAVDPDCDETESLDELFGCSKGAVGCDGNGFCVYESTLYAGEWDVVMIGVMIAVFPPLLVICLVCCCLVCVFVGPAVVNISVVYLFREAKKKRAARAADEAAGTPYTGLEEEGEEETEMGNIHPPPPVASMDEMEFETVGDITGPDFRNEDFDNIGDMDGGEDDGDNFSIKRKKPTAVVEESFGFSNQGVVPKEEKVGDDEGGVFDDSEED